MKILFVPDSTLDGISARWRCVNAGKALAAKGHTVEYFEPRKAYPELVVMSRPIWADSGALVRSWRQRGIPVICDIDDLFIHGAVPEGHGEKGAVYHGMECAGWPEAVNAAFHECSALTFATKPFLKYYRQYEATLNGKPRPMQVLSNYYDDLDPQWEATPLDMRPLKPGVLRRTAKGRDTIRLGLLGSKTHSRDLLWIKPALAEVLDRVKNAEVYMTQGNEDLLEDLPRIYPVPGTDWQHYSQALASLDVILAPLEPCALNDCKSYIRPLEANLVGRPWVASSSPDYENYAYGTGSFNEDAGAGIMVHDRGWPHQPEIVHERWTQELLDLIQDEGRMAELGNNGYQRSRAFAMSRHVEEHERFYSFVIENERNLW